MKLYPLAEFQDDVQALTELTLDLHWTWSHSSDELWEILDSETWELTQNPWMILNNISQERLIQLLKDDRFSQKLKKIIAARKEYCEAPGWYGQTYGMQGPKSIAYFSMEFGVGEALPLYAGGLGILASDHLKTASDLGVPMVGVGLLYYDGYLRQMLDANDWQFEFFPHNDSTSLPISQVRDVAGGLLRVSVELPGRKLFIRVWKAQLGKVPLYLLDSNDPLNSPADQGITSRLYAAGRETRLLQEVILGIGGWRALEALGVEPEVCHLNEGHAAFVVLERVARLMQKTGTTFNQALWASRAGNVFTTHTPVAAAFDRFDASLIEQYFNLYINNLGITMEQLLALGKLDSNNHQEPFSMTHLALRGSGKVNGVSKLHGEVSRKLFNSMFPRWPWQEIPVGHITNGVHVSSWDSKWADDLWTKACGKQRWLGTLDEHYEAIQVLPDDEVWSFRAAGRHALVAYARQRLARQLGQHGAGPEMIEAAKHVLDPNALTLGFARRFTAYKRPNLLFSDAERLVRMLTDIDRPVQLVVAGKAHPQDVEGKQLLQYVVKFFKSKDVQQRVVFLEDYDLSLAQHMVHGIDVWINTPRRKREACGTSGMKVLVNGGLNLSEPDGWWAEAYSPDVGWTFGDVNVDESFTEHSLDAFESQKLYDILEQEVIPEFYNRDERGIPRDWVARIRNSMAKLAPYYSSNRMLREYVEQCYLPSAEAYQRRQSEGAGLVVEVLEWQKAIADNWEDLHFGNIQTCALENAWRFEVQVYLGDIQPHWVNVELFAADVSDQTVIKVLMERRGEIPGAINGFVYAAVVPSSRPVDHYVPRIVPIHPDVLIPLEESHIFWQR